MGSHQITREGEMYYCLLLILLISPAFGRPGSSREYVEELIEQTLTPNITLEELRRILSEDRALILNTEEKQAKYEEDKEYTEKVRSGCKIISWFTFGLCSLIHHYVNEVPLEQARVEREDLERRSQNLTERAEILKKDVNEAIEIMDDEIKLIDKWAISAEKMEKNIDDIPEESLRVFEAFRLVFKLGLDDLKKPAENFLAQPMHIL